MDHRSVHRASPAPSRSSLSTAAGQRPSVEPPFYLIGDVAALTGLTAHALRAWEHVGLLAPRRSEGGVRQYSEDDLARVRLIIRTQRTRRVSRRTLATMLRTGELRPDPVDYVSGRLRPASPHASGHDATTASVLVADEAERYRLLFDAAGRVAAIVVSGAPLREVLTAICRETCVAFGVADSLLWLLETPDDLPSPASEEAAPASLNALDRPSDLRIAAAYGPRAPSVLKSARRLRIQRGVWLALWRTMRTTHRGIIIRSQHTHLTHRRNTATRDHTVELLAVPLIASSGETLGALVLREVKESARFTDEDVERAQLFATQAGLAIEHARHHSEVEEARDQAEAARARWQATVDHAPVLVASCDDAGRMTSFNPALEVLLGHVADPSIPPERWMEQWRIERSAGCVLPAGDAAPLWRAMTERAPVRDVRLPHRAADGTLRVIAWDCAPIEAPSGMLQGAIAVGRDVTAEQRHHQREACLAAVQHAAASVPDPTVALEARAGRVLEVLAHSAGLPVVTASLHVLDQAAQHLRRTGIHGANPASRPEIALDGHDAAGRMLLAQAHFSDSSGAPPPWYDATQRALWDATGIQAWATVPLRSANGPLGALSIGLGASHDWDEAERAWIAACADTIALALENERLFAAERHRAEELEAILQAVDAGIIVLDAQGHMVMRNAAAATLTAHPEVTGIADVDAYALRDAQTGMPVALADTPVMRALRGEQVRDAQFLMRDGLGRIRVMLSSSAPVRDRTGSAVGAVTFFRDITAEERRTRLYERLFGQLGSSLEPAAEMQLLADALVEQGQFAAAAVYATAPDAQSIELLAARDYPADLLPLAQRIPRDAEALSARALRTGQPHIIARWDDDAAVGLAVARQMAQRMETGGIAALPLLARGAVVGVLVVTVRRPDMMTNEDVELLREVAWRAALTLDNAELYQKVRGTAAQLHAIINAMAESVWVCDITGRLTLVNAAAHDLFRLPPGAEPRSLDDFGRNIMPRWPDGQPMAAEDSPLSRGLRGEVSTEFEGILRQRDTGRDLTLQMSYAPIRDDTGAITGAVSVGRDVTTLRELERLRQEFLAIASHEMKTPLTTLLGFVQLIRRRHAQFARQHRDTSPGTQLNGTPAYADPRGDDWPRKEAELLARIEYQAHRLDRLVSDLLDDVRIQQGRLEYRFAEGDIAGAVAEAVYEQRAAHPERVIHLREPGEPLLALIDADRIGQVVTNLLTNALKYSRQEEAVDVTVEASRSATSGQAEAVVRVRDRGPGIPPEHVAQVFERFYRVPGVEVRSGSGIGLGVGLHVAQTIVERHNGRIWAENGPDAHTRHDASTTPDQSGAIFTFTIPLLPERR